MASGIRILNSFDMTTDKPIDTRFTVDNITALLAIPSYQKYIGLQTYVLDINTRFKWNGTNFEVEHVGFCSGNGEPSDADFSAGDVYINKENGDVYYKKFDGTSSISWVYQTNIIGPQGPQGIEGQKGVHGSYWYSGVGITGTSTAGQVFPNSGVAQAEFNDQYINGSTGNLYKCTIAGSPDTAQWVYSGVTLKGPEGEKGDPGDQGIPGQTGDTGPQGIRGTKYNFGTAAYGNYTDSVIPNIEEFDVLPGDMYVNTKYGHYYFTNEEGVSTSVKWSRLGVIYGSKLNIVNNFNMDTTVESSYAYPDVNIEYSNAGDVIFNILNGYIYTCNAEGDKNNALWKCTGSVKVSPDSIAFPDGQSISDVINQSIKQITSENGNITYTTIGGNETTVPVVSGATVTSAPKLTTPREIKLSGDVSGSTMFDGSENVVIDTTVTGFLPLDGGGIVNGPVDMSELHVNREDAPNATEGKSTGYYDGVVLTSTFIPDNNMMSAGEREGILYFRKIDNNTDNVPSLIIAADNPGGSTQECRITNVADPIRDDQAATKGYVDNAVANVTITCDDTLNNTSTNPVQNKILYAKIAELEAKITTAQNTANAAKTVTDKYQTMLNIIGNNQ